MKNIFYYAVINEISNIHHFAQSKGYRIIEKPYWDPYDVRGLPDELLTEEKYCVYFNNPLPVLRSYQLGHSVCVFKRKYMPPVKGTFRARILDMTVIEPFSDILHDILKLP